MSEENNPESVILYDTSTYTQWTSEINLSKHQDVYTKYQKNQKNNYNYALRLGVWLKNKLTQRSNENTLKFLFTSNKPWNQWKLAVSKHEDLICVLQEKYIEVYHEFTNLLWRVEIETEFVKVCNVFFNRQNDMLIYTNDMGNIYFFDINDGTELLKYIEAPSIEYENSICKMFFIDCENFNLGEEVLEIFFTVTYSGYFNVFAINSNKTVTKIYTQSLLNIIPSGVYCVEIDSDLQYLIIGSFASNSTSYSSKNYSNGLFMWRILNSEPWIKYCPNDNEVKKSKNAVMLDKNLTRMNFSKIEYITKLEISPDNKSCTAIYVSGKISVFAIPSMKLINEWFMTEQPNYDEVNSEIAENPYELKMFKQIYCESDFRVIDIGWWSKKVIIMTRGTGLLSLVSKEDLGSLMGRNQQWLSPYPTIYPHYQNGFIILDCSCNLVSQSDLDMEHNESNLSDEEDEDDDDDDEDSWYYYIKQTVRTQAYNLSGIERFKIKPKKNRNFFSVNFHCFILNQRRQRSYLRGSLIQKSMVKHCSWLNHTS